MELAKLDVFVCIETLRSYVNRLDFKSYKAAHKPRLTTRHRKSRLLWAKEHIHWTKDQSRNVVWSDESCFCIEGSKRGKRVLWKESVMRKEIEYLQSSGMVLWSGMLLGRRLWAFRNYWQQFCRPRNIHQYLANRFHPWFTNVTMHQERSFIFQDDGVSCHTDGYAWGGKEIH